MLNEIERELNPINVYPPRIKVNTRISLKVDSLENWLKSTMPIHVGEAAVSYILLGGRKQHYQIKIGDGKKVWKDLEFLWVDPNEIDFSQLNDGNVEKLEEKLEKYFVDHGIFNMLSAKVDYIERNFVSKNNISTLVEDVLENDVKISENVYEQISVNINNQVSNFVTQDFIHEKMQIISAGCSKKFNFK